MPTGLPKLTQDNLRGSLGRPHLLVNTTRYLLPLLVRTVMLAATMARNGIRCPVSSYIFWPITCVLARGAHTQGVVLCSAGSSSRWRALPGRSQSQELSRCLPQSCRITLAQEVMRPYLQQASTCRCKLRTFAAASVCRWQSRRCLYRRPFCVLRRLAYWRVFHLERLSIRSIGDVFRIA